MSLPRPYVLPPDGTDVSRVFVLPLPVATMRYVKGLEFRPGNARVVHHANIRIDRTPASRQLDDRDPAPGYDGLLPAFRRLPRRPFSRLDAGTGAPLLPKGLAWRLAPGTDLVVEVHMKPSGRSESIEPSIGLYFGDDPPGADAGRAAPRAAEHRHPGRGEATTRLATRSCCPSTSRCRPSSRTRTTVRAR